MMSTPSHLLSSDMCYSIDDHVILLHSSYSTAKTLILSPARVKAEEFHGIVCDRSLQSG